MFLSESNSNDSYVKMQDDESNRIDSEAGEKK